MSASATWPVTAVQVLSLELEDALALYEKRVPEVAAEATAIREAIRHLTTMQREARALVEAGGTIEAMRALVFEGTARVAWIIREYNRKHDRARHAATH